MITNPRHGWCNFKLGNFDGRPSYITEVPVDLLNAFISYHLNGSGSAYFDEEGSTFVLVLSPDSVYIIEEKENSILHTFPDINIKDLEKELILDVELCIDGWAKEFTIDEEEVEDNKDKIKQLIGVLREIELAKEISFVEIDDYDECNL